MDVLEKYSLEQTFKISQFEKDINNAIKIGALLNDLQLVAAKSINNIDPEYGIEGLSKVGLGWFLIRYCLEFENYPISVDEITVKTEFRGCQRMATYRDFFVYNSDSSELLLKATSTWFIVDLENKSVLNIAKKYPNMLLYSRREGDINLQRLVPANNFTNQKVFHVRYDDLDMNGHVNNTVYIIWAMEAIDYEFRISHKLLSLDIYFKKEVKYDDEIVSFVNLDKENLVSEHVIRNAKTDEDVCIIKAKFVCL